MNEGGFPTGFAIIIAAVVLAIFGFAGIIVAKVLVGF